MHLLDVEASWNMEDFREAWQESFDVLAAALTPCSG